MRELRTSHLKPKRLSFSLHLFPCCLRPIIGLHREATEIKFANVCLTMFGAAESLNIAKTFIPTPPIFPFLILQHHTREVPRP